MRMKRTAIAIINRNHVLIQSQPPLHRWSFRKRQPQRSAGDRLDVKPTDLGLTERQVDVLALIMRGKSNKAICRVLELAEPTVKNFQRTGNSHARTQNREFDLGPIF
jgi:DNA-binding NarL/FixJ family response regulator